MKAHTFKELAKICKDQSYKFCALYGENNQKLSNFNKLGSDPIAHLQILEKRLNSPALENGVYYIYFTNKASLKPNNFFDKYPVIKGNFDLSENKNEVKIIEVNKHNTENVLSYAAALEMQKKIAELNFTIDLLNRENKYLTDKINDLKTEIEEQAQQLEENENLKKPSQLAEITEKAGAWLKDLAPIFAPVIEKHYTLKEKQIDLANKELDLKYKANKIKPIKAAKKMKPEIEIGSPEHIQLIIDLDAAENYELVNWHLDLLEEHDVETYNNLIEKLGYTIAPENENENENE